MPTVEIIVLNYNGLHYLDDCMRALLKQPLQPHQITVVDNASTDDSVTFLKASFPQINLIEGKTNSGFSAGNNLALNQSTADVAILVNPDVIVSGSWLVDLLAVVESDSTIGVVGCLLLYPDGESVQHAGSYLTRPLGLPFHDGLFKSVNDEAWQLRDVDYVIGAAMAIRRPLLTQIGGLDEHYFLYFEDTDYCYQARKAGWRVVFAPSAEAIHVESAVTGRSSLFYLQHFHRGRLRCVTKFWDREELLAFCAAEVEYATHCTAHEQTGLRYAYSFTLAHFAELWAWRDDCYDAALRAALLATLQQCYALVVAQVGSESAEWDQLLAAAEIPEPAIINPLRKLWNHIANRWHVRKLQQQQNAYNRALAQALEQQTAHLIEQRAWLQTLKQRAEATRRQLEA